MRRIWFSILAIAVLWLRAQASPDSLNGPDSTSVVCVKNGWFGSGTSWVRLSLRYWIDNTEGDKIVYLGMLCKIYGDNVVWVDTTVAATFEGSGVSHFDIKSVGEYPPSGDTFVVSYGAVTFHAGVTGESLLANIVVQVNDTGTICIDTAHVCFLWPCSNSFITEQATAYAASWSGPYCCKVELHPPGDANLDKKVNIADVVAGVSYVYRGKRPASLQAADYNGDCVVTMADFLGLFHHLYKGGPPPQIGCAK